MGDLADTFEWHPIRKPDKRGFWPLAEARAHLAALKRCPTQMGDVGDSLWCALLSLEDAKEFVREARRLKLSNDPRGTDNIALFERYGEGILPWLADHLNPDTGRLRNVPWNVIPLLLCIGSDEAFDVVFASRKIDGPQEWDTPEKLIGAYAARFPEIAFKGLASRTLAGDASAAAALKKLAKGRSKRALAAIETTLGTTSRQQIAKQLGIRAKLEPAEVLAVLDEASQNDDMFAWPRFSYGFEDRLEYSGLRLVAARAKDDERWGIALERITGCSAQEIEVRRYLYGSEVTPGFSVDEPARCAPLGVELDVDDSAGSAVGASARGSAGGLTVTRELLKSLDLRPGKGSEPEGAVGGPTVVLVRAYLASFPSAIWPSVDDAVRALRLDPARSVVAACTDAFAHANGVSADAPTKLPSSSKAYQSAAKAIVARDPAKFTPGTPNTDWRKHARFRAPK